MTGLELALTVVVAVVFVLLLGRRRIPPEAPRVTIPRFSDLGKGLNVQADSVYAVDELLPILRDLGVAFVRTPLPLDWATGDGQHAPDFSPWTAFVERLTGAGIGVLFIAPFSLSGPSSEQTIARDGARIAAYIGQAARLWPSVHWELGNEPNVQQGPNEPISHGIYVPFANAVLGAIRSASPRAMVLCAGVSGADFGYLRACLADGLRPVDGFPIHPYANTAATMRAALEAGYAALGTGTAICVSEWGRSTAIVSEADQAIEYAAMRAELRLDGVGLFAWYTLRDGTDAADSGDKFGLLRLDGSRKASYAAFKAAS